MKKRGIEGYSSHLRDLYPYSMMRGTYLAWILAGNFNMSMSFYSYRETHRSYRAYIIRNFQILYNFYTRIHTYPHIGRYLSASYLHIYLPRPSYTTTYRHIYDIYTTYCGYRVCTIYDNMSL